MSRFTISIDYKDRNPVTLGNEHQIERINLHFEDGTNLHITPSRIGHGKITILGRCRKPARTALSMTRRMGVANRVEIEARHKTKGD